MPFVTAAKPVFQIEYGGSLNALCATSRSLGFMSVKKNLSLDAFRDTCW